MQQKTILITGSSTGIGWCAAETLHKRGYQVFASARKPADLARLQALGVEAVMLDMDDSDTIHSALAQVLEKTGGTLSALFNNAGVALPGAVEDLTRDMMRAQFETNVFGPMELTNLVLPIMRKQGYGRIIHNTSILGVITMPYRGNYNASKFALEAYTSTLRQELRKEKDIHVSIIAPGPIATQFRETAKKNFEDMLGDKTSVHSANYEKLKTSFKVSSATEKKVTSPPSAVVDQVIAALESKHPAARYYVGLPAHLFAWLRRLLPDESLDWVIDKLMSGEAK